MGPKYFLTENLDQIRNRLFLFFDFDGTLVPIQNDPYSCLLDEEIKTYLKKIVKKDTCNAGILTGRSLKDIRKRVNIRGLFYAGNHGLEITGPQLKFIHPEVKPLLKVIKKAKETLQKSISHLQGVFIEDKGISFTVHFRMADRKDRRLVKSILDKTLIREFDNGILKVLKGKKILEVAPNIDWNKGKAVQYMLRLYNKDKFLPLYIGDDLTDETVFSALKGCGITVRVGYSKKTDAEYYIKSQREIHKFFKKMCGIIKR